MFYIGVQFLNSAARFNLKFLPTILPGTKAWAEYSQKSSLLLLQYFVILQIKCAFRIAHWPEEFSPPLISRSGTFPARLFVSYPMKRESVGKIVHKRQSFLGRTRTAILFWSCVCVYLRKQSLLISGPVGVTSALCADRSSRTWLSLHSTAF